MRRPLATVAWHGRHVPDGPSPIGRRRVQPGLVDGRVEVFRTRGAAGGGARVAVAAAARVPATETALQRRIP